MTIPYHTWIFIKCKTMVNREENTHRMDNMGFDLVPAKIMVDHGPISWENYEVPTGCICGKNPSNLQLWGPPPSACFFNPISLAKIQFVILKPCF